MTTSIYSQKFFGKTLAVFLLTLSSLGAAKEFLPNYPYFKIKGSITNDGLVAARTTLLNSENSADCTNWGKTTFDLKGNYEYGKEICGYKAVEVCSTFRAKQYWGDVSRTGKASIAVENTQAFTHVHPNSKPEIWLKEAWIEVNLDGLAEERGDGFNKIKSGMFPFSLGKGIALGSNYGVTQGFLGEFVRENDHFMPGILFHGKIPSLAFGYSLYFATPHAKSAAVAQVLGISKDHLLETQGIGFGGAFKDDRILAAQIDILWNCLDNCEDEEAWIAQTSPYVLWFNSPDSKVNVVNDSNINLITAGIFANFAKNSFDVSFDGGMSFGKQTVKAVDQNQTILERDAQTGTFTFRYSHIKNTADDLKALATDALRNELLKNKHRDLEPFFVGDDVYYSSPDRLTNQYSNKLRGYYSTADISYMFEDYATQVAAVAGMSSGDKNPHLKKEDKTYNGFIGINESFESKKVPSMLVLGGLLRRPLSLDEDGSVTLKDYNEGSFTDIRFVGFGISTSPSLKESWETSFVSNFLMFWKDSPSKKIIAGTDISGPSLSSETSSTFLGNELNFGVKVEPIKDLVFELKAAVFMPGQYYKDISGAKFDDATTKALEAADLDNVTKSKYSLGHDLSFVLGLTTKYSF